MPRQRALLLVAAVAAVVVAAAAPSSASAAPCVADTPSLMLNASVDIPFDCPVTEEPRLGTRPWCGTATLVSGTAGPVVFRYVPDRDVRCIDRFTWSAGDGQVGEVHVVVGATLRLTCEAVSRLYQTPGPFLAHDGHDQELDVRCANRVSGDSWDLEITRPPAHGTVTIADAEPWSGELLRYRPNPGYVGPDSFAARAVSRVPGRTSASFEVPITVKGPNRAPVCPAVPLTVVPVDSVKHFPSLCSDPDDDPLSYGLVVKPASGDAFFGPDLVLNYRPRPGWTGSDTIRVVVGDGFTTSGVDIPVEVRAPDPPAPPPPVPPAPAPAPPPPPALPAPPAGFAAARGLDLGADVAAWSPAGAVRLGRRALPVIALGCRTACTVDAQLRLYPPRRRGPVALPPQTVRLDAGRHRVLRMRLTGAARTAVRGRRRVKAVLSLAARAGAAAPVRDALTLRVALPAAKRRSR